MKQSDSAELSDAMVRAAGFFRLGQSGEGHDALAMLVDRLTLELTPQLAPAAIPVLEQVLEAQVRGDLLLLADLLEHGLAKVFENSHQITHLSE